MSQRRGRLPARAAQPVSALLLSGLMTLLVSGTAALRTSGDAGTWATAFLSAWPVAFPVVLLLAPVVRRAVVTHVLSWLSPRNTGRPREMTMRLRLGATGPHDDVEPRARRRDERGTPARDQWSASASR